MNPQQEKNLEAEMKELSDNNRFIELERERLIQCNARLYEEIQTNAGKLSALAKEHNANTASYIEKSKLLNKPLKVGR